MRKLKKYPVEQKNCVCVCLCYKPELTTELNSRNADIYFSLLEVGLTHSEIHYP